MRISQEPFSQSASPRSYVWCGREECARDSVPCVQRVTERELMSLKHEPYTCLYRVSACVHVNACAGQNSTSYIVSEVPDSLRSETGSPSLTWSSLRSPGYPVRILHGSVCLCLLSSGVTSVTHYLTQVFYLASGRLNSNSPAQGIIATPLSHLPRP